MRLDILISTINERISSLHTDIFRSDNSSVYVVHQITDGRSYKEYETNLKSKGIIYQSLFFKGLSRNRNQALQLSEGDLFWITDDDITPADHFSNVIIDSFLKFPDADIITFRIKTPENHFYKSYPADEHPYTLRTLAKVSSVEIVVRKKWWAKHKLLFDERFGLASAYQTGEEYIFLSDALKLDARIIHADKVIAYHPAESSGKNFTKDMIEAKGALFARIFPGNWRIYNFLFSLKKYKQYKNNFSFLHFLNLMNKGSFQFLKNA